MTWYQRRSRQSVEAVTSPQPDALPHREEINSLLRSLMEVNSYVDAQLGQHTSRVKEITHTLETECDSDRGPLIRAAKLLVTANQRLQTDLIDAKSELQHQRELVDSFKHESRTDALTELSNRRAFDGELTGCLAKRKREKTALSLLFIDIDHFKGINDEHGHANGDLVLRAVAQCLKASLQVPASVSRYGGEEFAVILPGIAGRSAMKIAEHLRRAVERCPHQMSGTQLSVTVSIGVAEALNGETSSEFIERSDRALFAAKNAGRNHCCYHDEVECRTTNLCAVSC